MPKVYRPTSTHCLNDSQEYSALNIGVNDACDERECPPQKYSKGDINRNRPRGILIFLTHFRFFEQQTSTVDYCASFELKVDKTMTVFYTKPGKYCYTLLRNGYSNAVGSASAVFLHRTSLQNS